MISGLEVAMNVSMRLTAVALMGLLILEGPAIASPRAAPDAPSGCLRASATGDGDTLTLSSAIEGTTVVRLAGVVSPLPPTPVTSGEVPAHGRATRDALATLIADRCLSLVPDLPMIDRYNRLYAHVYRDDGIWIQGQLVRDGLLIVFPGLDEPGHIRQLLPLEAAARDAKRGLWASTNVYAVRTPEQAAHYVGTFQLVEGNIRKATRVGPSIYLNFGDDWRTDFTVVIPASALKSWVRGGIDPLQFAGKRIRVRGFIEMMNGPMIEAPQSEMIEPIESKD